MKIEPVVTLVRDEDLPHRKVRAMAGNLEVCAYYIKDRVSFGRAVHRHQAVELHSHFPAYSYRLSSIDECVNEFKQMGIHDPELFLDMCRDNGWMVI